MPYVYNWVEQLRKDASTKGFRRDARYRHRIIKIIIIVVVRRRLRRH